MRAHVIWHRFYNWLIKKFGKDLINKPNESLLLNQRLVGWEVIKQIEKYVKRYAPEIKIIYCDDSYHSSSIILLIPHPKFGITVMYIPQNSGEQNNFFLYRNNCTSLIRELKNMKNFYKII